MTEKRLKRRARTTDRSPAPAASQLRIIGGKFRGSRLKYSGDPRTRPMKDRVREAVFNLVGPAIKGTHAVDLFAGTGALALEAISRGSIKATAIERHFPTARVIEENVEQLNLGDHVQVVASDTFFWASRLPELGDEPWVVFCCPPYALYQERPDDMRALIQRMTAVGPIGKSHHRRICGRTAHRVATAPRAVGCSRVPAGGDRHLC